MSIVAHLETKEKVSIQILDPVTRALNQDLQMPTLVVAFRKPPPEFHQYENSLDATRNLPGASKSRIITALKNGTIYMGHRWCKVEHGLDEKVVVNLSPTVITRQPTRGLVAKLKGW